MSSRKRCRNFTSSEIDLLLDLMTEPVIEVIENKMIDSATLVCKSETWTKLTERFHEAGGGADRDTKSLKSCWKRLKEFAKKEKMIEERQMSDQTDGDMSFTMTGKSRKVCSILPKQRVQGFLESENNSFHSSLSFDRERKLSDLPMLHKPFTLPLAYDERMYSPEITVKSRASTPVSDTPITEVTVPSTSLTPIQICPDPHLDPPFSISEKCKKRKLSPYQEELLMMAREEHEAKMINLRLKRQFLEARLKKIEKLDINA